MCPKGSQKIFRLEDEQHYIQGICSLRGENSKNFLLQCHPDLLFYQMQKVCKKFAAAELEKINWVHCCETVNMCVVKMHY